MSNKDTNEDQGIPSLLSSARKDRIYATKEAYTFAFGEEVATVFDDMISRTVPGYLDLQVLVASCAEHFYQQNTSIYDLGCSTGTSLALIAKRLPSASNIYGVDSSEAMLLQAREKLTRLQVLDRVMLQHETLERLTFQPSCFITANYTLQFLQEDKRLPLLERIYQSLVPGGALLLSEKTQPNLPAEDQELIRVLHEDFKVQNGYSDLEVARKRESLKGVMRPIAEERNEEELFNVGFSKVIPVLRGYSFMSWICLKGEKCTE